MQMNIFRLLPIVMLLLLAACSKAPTLTIPEDKQLLIGVWEYHGSDPDRGISRNEMLLAFHPDSTVSYKHCIDRNNGYSYITLPKARIIELDNNRIVISMDFLFSDLERKLEIQSWPFRKDDHWHMNINGLLLKKLNQGEKSTHGQWRCDKEQVLPDNDKQDIRF